MLQLGKNIRGNGVLKQIVSAMIVSVMVYHPTYASPRDGSLQASERNYASLPGSELLQPGDLQAPTRPVAKHVAESREKLKAAKSQNLFERFQYWHKNLPDQALSELNVSSYEDLSEEQLETIRNFFSEPSKISFELIQLQKLLVERLEELKAVEGLDAVEERLRTGRKDQSIEVEIAGVGKSEIILLGGETNRFISRVTHYGTHLSYVFLDGTGVSPDNKDLQRMLSDNIVKGSGTDIERYDGIAKSQIPGSDFIHKNYGRETVIIRASDYQLEDGTKYEPKSKSEQSLYERLTNTRKDVSFSTEQKAEYFGHRWNFKAGGLKSLLSYWKNIYVPASSKDWMLGLLSGALQFMVAGSLSAIQAGGFSDMAMAPAMLSLAYGSIIGIWNNTYRNFGMGGSQQAQTIKFFSLSVSFAYFLSYFRGDFVEAAFFSAVAFTATHSDIITNNMMNGALKPLIHRVPEIRERTGESKGTIKIQTRKSIDMGYMPSPIGEVGPRIKRRITSKNEIEFLQRRSWYMEDMELVNKGITKAELEKVRSERVLNQKYFFDTRTNTFHYRLYLLGLNIDTGFYRPTAENQAAYTVLYTGKMIDLMDVPQGKLLFALMFPLTEYYAVNYLEKHGYKDAEMYREAWEAKKFNAETTDEFLRIGEKLENFPMIKKSYMNSLRALGKVPYGRAVLVDLPAFAARVVLRSIPTWTWNIGSGLATGASKALEYSLGLRKVKHSSEKPTEHFDKETRLIQSTVDAQKEMTLVERGARALVDGLNDKVAKPVKGFVTKQVSKSPVASKFVSKAKSYAAQKMSNKSRFGQACRYVWLSKQERRTLAESSSD